MFKDTDDKWRRRVRGIRLLPVLMLVNVGVERSSTDKYLPVPPYVMHGRDPMDVVPPRAQDQCDSCSLNIKLVATLGEADDSFLIHPFASVDRDSRGTYYVGRLFESGHVGVYDKTGVFVRTIGKPGQGPGEHVIVDRVRVGMGDTVYTIDNRTRRLTVWHPAGTMVRTVPLRSEVLDVVPLRSGAFIIRGSIGSAASIGFPFHLIGAGGEFKRSLGAINPEAAMGTNYLTDRVISSGGGALIWSAHRNQYQVELWDTAGKLIRTVIPTGTSWFTAWKSESDVPAELQARQSVVVGVRASGNTVWLLTAVAARNFKPGAPKPKGKKIPATDGYFDSPKYTEYMLEAMSMKSGKIIGSTRLTNMIVGGFLSFGDHDALYSKRQRTDGTVAVDVWRLNLQSPNSITRKVK